MLEGLKINPTFYGNHTDRPKSKESLEKVYKANSSKKNK